MLYTEDKIRVLKRGLKRLERKNGWTRNVLARDRAGKEVHPSSKRAVAFCALGAINDSGTVAEELRKNIPAQYVRSISEFNDGRRTKGPILTLYRRTISRLEKELGKLRQKGRAK